MSDYRVEFKIHLIPHLKPKKWKNPLIHDAIFRVNSYSELKASVDKHIMMFVAQYGFVNMKKTDKPYGDDIRTMDLRQFVPLHMVSHVESVTTLLTGRIPDIEEEGLLIQ
jgi:hypothetical protein